MIVWPVLNPALIVPLVPNLPVIKLLHVTALTNVKPALEVALIDALPVKEIEFSQIRIAFAPLDNSMT